MHGGEVSLEHPVAISMQNRHTIAPLHPPRGERGGEPRHRLGDLAIVHAHRAAGDGELFRVLRGGAREYFGQQHGSDVIAAAVSLQEEEGSWRRIEKNRNMVHGERDAPPLKKILQILFAVLLSAPKATAGEPPKVRTIGFLAEDQAAAGDVAALKKCLADIRSEEHTSELQSRFGIW